MPSVIRVITPVMFDERFLLTGSRTIPVLYRRRFLASVQARQLSAYRALTAFYPVPLSGFNRMNHHHDVPGEYARAR